MAVGYTVGDLEPPLSGVVKDGELAVDLRSAEAVVVHIKRTDSSLLTKVATQGDQALAPGTWSAAWDVGDLLVAGRYKVEVEVSWPGARPQTFGPMSFSVHAAIA